MSFFKIYPNRKDRRKQYRDSRRFDPSCRNHGSCSRCYNNRTYQLRKERTRAEEALKEYEEES